MHYATFDGGSVRCPAANHLMKPRLFALLVFAAFIAACYAAARQGSPVGAADEQTVLRVDNRAFLDMTIYAARSSQRVRLGTASGNSNTVFTIPRSLMSGTTALSFIADPIGSSRASISEEIVVTPGDSVVLLIPPG